MGIFIEIKTVVENSLNRSFHFFASVGRMLYSRQLPSGVVSATHQTFQNPYEEWERLWHFPEFPCCPHPDMAKQQPISYNGSRIPVRTPPPATADEGVETCYCCMR